MAKLVAKRATCSRRSVGCVLVDEYDHVLATGYNGVPKGSPHCNEGFPCQGSVSGSGEDLHKCVAIHAEQNALLQCRDVMSIKAAYVTVNPCEHCLKMLLNTSVKYIYFQSWYPNAIITDFGDIVEEENFYKFIRKESLCHQ